MKSVVGFITLGLALGATVSAEPAASVAIPDLEAVLQQRFQHDRTGACVLAARTDAGAVQRARVCADAQQAFRVSWEHAFEIGSISKTMTATLLAGLIDAGQGSLDDPLADWLPEGTPVPDWQGEPIRLRHLVTHSSGLPPLPPGLEPANPSDPYADMAPDAVRGALARVQLPGAPGTQPVYSNFAAMLLSEAVSRRAGEDFNTLLAEHLFAPLGMGGAWVEQPGADTLVATGHLATGTPTSAWHFPPNMAGVGGVRATLDDLVRYLQAQLHPDLDTPLGRAIAMTQQDVTGVPAPLARGMHWFIQDIGGQRVIFHEGGTGGFSALVAFIPQLDRGVALLADTSLTDLGGLSAVGLHLLGLDVPVAPARRAASPPAELLEALRGDYVLEGVGSTALTVADGALFIQVTGQPRIQLAYDSAGDFYPPQFDALLHPVEYEPGAWAFRWHQGGGVFAAARQAPAPAIAIEPGALADYAGIYPLLPGFELVVFVQDQALHARATGQSAFALQSHAKDSFAAPAFGIRIDFQRDENDTISALKLHQGGQTLEGQRQ